MLRQITWYFAFEKDATCTTWIQKLQNAINYMKYPASARMGMPRRIGLDDSTDMNDGMNLE